MEMIGNPSVFNPGMQYGGQSSGETGLSAALRGLGNYNQAAGNPMGRGLSSALRGLMLPAAGSAATAGAQGIGAGMGAMLPSLPGAAAMGFGGAGAGLGGAAAAGAPAGPIGMAGAAGLYALTHPEEVKGLWDGLSNSVKDIFKVF